MTIECLETCYSVFPGNRNQAPNSLDPAPAYRKGTDRLDCSSQAVRFTQLALSHPANGEPVTGGNQLLLGAFSICDGRNTLRIPHNHQPAPDIVFFRNTGIALTTLAMAAGFISVIGSLGAGEPSMQIKSASDLVQSTELIMRQTDPNVSRREAFQAGYVNPEGSTQ